MAARYEIKITDGQRELHRFTCRADEPLLHSMRRHPVREIPRGCGGGGCGVCKIVVKSGAHEVIQPMSRAHVTEGEESNNIRLACCVAPRGDMEIGLFAARGQGS
jgi:ferredoxin